jgi:hypothetical protein
MTAAVMNSQLIDQDAEPPFSNAHAALVFTFNHTNQIYDRPMMARMAGAPTGGGKGLGGSDGAGQAGFIRHHIETLPRLHQAILVARFAPRAMPCPCCKGSTDNPIWMAAIREISDAAVCAALSSHFTSRVLRDAIVRRYFGAKVNMSVVADKADVSGATATKHGKMIQAWLRGTRIGKEKGGNTEPGKVGEEARAMDAAGDILVAQRICR